MLVKRHFLLLSVSSLGLLSKEIFLSWYAWLTAQRRKTKFIHFSRRQGFWPGGWSGSEERLPIWKRPLWFTRLSWLAVIWPILDSVLNKDSTVAAMSEASLSELWYNQYTYLYSWLNKLARKVMLKEQIITSDVSVRAWQFFKRDVTSY